MRRFLLLAASLVSLSTASAALAQTQQQPEDLTRLHDALNLSQSQENAWRAYVAAIGSDPQTEARHRSASRMMQSLTTPRRIDLIEAEMQADMLAMRRQGAAVKAFYAQLSPGQQHTFDTLTYEAEQQRGRSESDE
jgi:methylphosphotriester-DNA--protein-cysteine methyltransferase